ncbi:Uncharacterized protein y4bA/y4pH [Chlamydiales bacterium SCGC AG-110-P3]|nr:Uncharacterized protein y4bA/y4pH [Chlamydiales bacterium SCGC AG-110-P3]
MKKLQKQHLERSAYIYLRQSTMAQVYNNQESTQRQYALENKAHEMGWPKDKIIILDSDLGLTGSQVGQRQDFKRLIADVSMRTVGAVFALEASRLSRSEADWHRLLELCAYSGTLIVDEDGCYDPADFNDQLLLGLKGTMSQAELHFIRARLLGGKKNKAKKGELRFPLPVGFCYDQANRVILDPDEEVRHSIRLIFSTFRRVRSAGGVAREFSRLRLKFPKRAYGGAWDGRLIWDHLTTSRVLNILKNPSYAGAYVYGRYTSNKELSSSGEVVSKIKCLPMPEWQVHINDHHEGYIKWEEYLENQSILAKNRTNGKGTMLSSVLREGCALLQGLLICGNCGQKLSPRYKGNGGLYPMYECNKAHHDNGIKAYCMSFRSTDADEAISRRIIEVLQSDQIELSLAALDQLEQRNNGIEKQWQLKIERVKYDALLAQRRYEEVDPSNRLVAINLESSWNQALLSLEEIKKDHEEFLRKEALCITVSQRERILSLGEDLPALWVAQSTKAKDRKQILQLLIKDITVEKNGRQLILHVRWSGGQTEDIDVLLPAAYYKQLEYSSEFVEEIRNLASRLTDTEIARKLNSEGRLSANKKPFTQAMINWIRSKHKIPHPDVTSQKTDEYTVKQVANRVGASKHMIYYWLETGVLEGRKAPSGSCWQVTLTPEKELDLKQKISESSHISKKQILQHKPEGGVI